MTESNNPSAIRSKNEITEALLSLMQNAPYNEISVKQIIMEARLARKTFYRNFESKDDVLISYLKGIIREYYDVVNTGKVNVLETIFLYIDKYRDLLQLLEKHNMLHLPLQCINEYLPVLHNKFFNECKTSSFLFKNLDSEYLMAFNTGAIWNVISLWVHRGMIDTPESVKKNITTYLKRMAKVPLF